jgi:hypothetical protein
VQQSLWFWQMRAIVNMLHTRSGTLGHVGDSLIGLHCLEQSDMHSVRDAFHGWLYQRWQDLPSDPRLAGSETVVCSTYESWFASAPCAELDYACPSSWCSEYVHNTDGIHKSHLASLIRFRLGVHGLRVATGRWELAGRSPLPRQQRVCCRCTGSLKSYENDHCAARYSREWPLTEVAHIKQTGTEQHLSMCCFG